MSLLHCIKNVLLHKSFYFTSPYSVALKIIVSLLLLLLQRFMKCCRKLVTILGCASPSDIDVHAPSTSMVQASGAATSSSHAGANTSHTGGGSDSGESEEEEEVDLQDDEAP